MSALTLAQDVLKELVARYPASPLPQWAQLGSPILTCQSTAVGVISSSEEALFVGNSKCGVIPNHTTMIVIARECGVTFDNEGNTVPSKVEEVSRMMEADAEAISDLLADLAQSGRIIGLPSTSYLNEGGIAATSLTAVITES